MVEWSKKLCNPAGPSGLVDTYLKSETSNASYPPAREGGREREGEGAGRAGGRDPDAAVALRLLRLLGPPSRTSRMAMACMPLAIPYGNGMHAVACVCDLYARVDAWHRVRRAACVGLPVRGFAWKIARRASWCARGGQGRKYAPKECTVTVTVTCT
jgi:hypothetical protein